VAALYQRYFGERFYPYKSVSKQPQAKKKCFQKKKKCVGVITKQLVIGSNDRRAIKNSAS
jgi:hypothetical protein